MPMIYNIYNPSSPIASFHGSMVLFTRGRFVTFAKESPP